MKTALVILMTTLFLTSCLEQNSKQDLIFEEISLSSTASSLQSYGATLFPILQQNCNSCHGSSQSPKFAVSDLALSHETLISFSLVDLQNPSSSRLVQKIQGGHQSFSSQIAIQIEDAIVAWADTAPTPDPTVDPPEVVDNGTKSDSVKIFETTVYPIINNNCTACHGSFQNPLFALPNSTDAHNNLIDFNLIDFTAAANSRIVQKIQGGHQNFNSSLATELENAIASWSTQLGSSNIPEPLKLEATFTSIHKLILVPKCLGCHSPGGERSQEDYTDYSSTMDTGKITAGDPQDSGMYKECVDGDMPQNATALNIEELDVIRDWIISGAKND